MEFLPKVLRVDLPGRRFQYTPIQGCFKIIACFSFAVIFIDGSVNVREYLKVGAVDER